jgi:hypothetical protein
MTRHRRLAAPIVLLAVSVALVACGVGSSASGSFTRTLSVAGPIRLELVNAAGDIVINGSADGKVHVQADVRASGISFSNPQQRINELVSNPPV